jgi:carboxylate-amine ligase
MAWEVAPLKKILLDTVREAEHAVIADRAYLENFGIYGKSGITAAELWGYLAEQAEIEKELVATFGTIVENGSLATRILKSLAGRLTKENLARVYRKLSGCLHENRLFLP